MSQSGHFRAHARYEVDFSATVETTEPEAAPRRPARIVNLSLGGACIEDPDTLADGAVVTVEVVSSILWDPLVLRARVAWTAVGQTGAARAGLCFAHDDAA